MNLQAHIAAMAPVAGTIEDVLGHLVDHSELDPADLDEARRLAGSNGIELAAVLDRLGLVSQVTWAEAAAEVLRLPLLRLADLPDPAPACPRLSRRFLDERAAILVALTAHEATFAVADPLDATFVKAVRLALRRSIRIAVAPRRDVEAALGRERARSVEATPRTVDPSDAGQLVELANDAPTIKFVDAALAAAVERGATDIHLEPFERAARLRLRIDGLLVEDRPIPLPLYPGVVSRLKILAGMDIGERRLPQDGRIRHRAGGQQLDIRVATMPTVSGESMALRLLHLNERADCLRALDMPADVLAAYERGLAQRSGLIVVTGPTGSGKTTTLHALLRELNDPGRKIVTVENPVEIRIPGVGQVDASPEIGLSFAAALRTFLRFDTNVIMVGEIRDVETARVAVQAALTGHVVLSTLHTNDAATSVPRLVDMGVEPYLVSATLKLAGAQRLVRRLCGACATPLPEDHPHRSLVEARADRLPPRAGWQLRAPSGCPSCHQSGYAGRRAVFEALDAEGLQAIAQGRSSPHRSLFDHGLDLVVAGETTLDEVLRVVEATR